MDNRSIRAKMAREMVEQRVPVEEIVIRTGYVRNTVMRIIKKRWGMNDPYPGKGIGRNETLCWGCANAVSRCAWSRYFVPVSGWDARETVIYCSYETGETKTIRSFFVRDCPEFIPDPPRKGEG